MGTQFANSILDLSSWTRDIRAFLKTCLLPWKRNQIDRRRKRSHPFLRESVAPVLRKLLVEFHSKGSIAKHGISKNEINQAYQSFHVRRIYLSKGWKFYNFTIFLLHLLKINILTGNIGNEHIQLIYIYIQKKSF